jgi:NAD(P)-dependent dehydrogenase (short-subunit alcohol dehydrogenase family)
MARTAVVTGGSRGIGAAISKALKQAGYNVAANYGGNDDAAAKFKQETGIPVYKWDVSSYEACVEGLKKVESEVGPVDILVNNAGVFPRVPFLDLDERDWDFVLDVNLKGACFCAQAAARAMLAAGRRGAIVNLTSGAAFRGSPQGVHYCASKGGVLSMTRQMALELAPLGIRVNCIAPGLTDTAQPRDGMSEEELFAAGRRLPLGRVAEPEEIARAALFLASEDAGFITGQCLHVNGGGYFG